MDIALAQTIERKATLPGFNFCVLLRGEIISSMKKACESAAVNTDFVSTRCLGTIQGFIRLDDEISWPL